MGMFSASIIALSHSSTKHEFSARIDTVSVSWVSLCLDVRVVSVYIHYRPFLSVSLKDTFKSTSSESVRLSAQWPGQGDAFQQCCCILMLLYIVYQLLLLTRRHDTTYRVYTICWKCHQLIFWHSIKATSADYLKLIYYIVGTNRCWM